MANEAGPDDAMVSSCIRSLGSLPNAPALPDPDRLWVLARISAREQASIPILAALGVAFMAARQLIGQSFVARRLSSLGLL